MTDFPTSVWDGITRRVVDSKPHVSPEAEDWNELVAELIATQTYLSDAGLRFDTTVTEGLEVKVHDEVLTLTNAVEVATNLAVPAGAVILSAQANLETLVEGDESGDDLLAKVGLGITGTIVKYGVTSALTKNSKIDTIPDWAVNAGETLKLFGVKADGSTACTEKFVAGSTVRVRVVYLENNSLDDA